MPYVTPKQIQTAKRMDLLTYLKNYEPEELVHVSGEVYCTKDHDSLKISNGKWCWFSQGIGGKSALDYLIKVKGLSFTKAVQTISCSCDSPDFSPATANSNTTTLSQKKLMLPPKNKNNKIVIKYLKFRGIDTEIINYCIRKSILYEDEKHHNAIFVGCDSGGIPKYGAIRGTRGYKFLGEVPGSNKHFSFFIPGKEKTDSVHIFESAIDLLSFATILKIKGRFWQQNSLLSLSGVYAPKINGEIMNNPKALETFLSNNKDIKTIYLHLDNDIVGRKATEALIFRLGKDYRVVDIPPGYGKDVNDTLRNILQRKTNYKEDTR